MNLDISNWKPFVTAKLFPVLKPGKANQQLLDEGDDCFYIGAKREDNGVMLHCSWDESLIQKGNCVIFICNGQGSVGYANYMDIDFIGTTDIIAGYNENLNPLVGLFLATVYSLERPKYSFGRKWKTHLKKTVVKLPVRHNEDGSYFLDKKSKYSKEGYVPDWGFMEQYIKSLNCKPLTTKNRATILSLDINQWKDFYVLKKKNRAGLFIIENCKCGCAGDLEEGNDINYIGAKKSDNGVMKKVKLDKSLISKGNGILFICDGEGSVGYTNYMKDDFIGSTTTSIGYNDDLNEINALFIVTVLDKERFKYSFGRKYRKHLSEIQIKLPILHNEDGSIYIDETHKYSEEGYVPDWRFMEQYIKQLPYGDRL